MTKCLPQIASTATCQFVTHLLIRLILAFAFVASTSHAPAIAHEEPASHHGNHGAASGLDTILDHHGDAPSSPEGTGDSVHHHHCPSALDTHGTDVALGAMSDKSLLALERSTVLTSFSQAPPTEPPSA